MFKSITRVFSTRGWTLEQNQLLVNAAKKLGLNAKTGVNDWREVADKIGRNAADCSKRWNYISNPSIKRGKWTPDEDEMLTILVKQLGESKWEEIALAMNNGRTALQIREHWVYALKSGESNKRTGPWSKEEDDQLLSGYEALGGKWTEIAKQYVSTRTSKQCFYRWRILKAK